MNLKTLIPCLIVLILFACGGSDNPRSVADKFLNAMSSQDFETAKKYGTEETEKLLDMMIGFSKMSPDSAIKDSKFEITKDVVDGDKATIFYKEDGKGGELQLPLIKVDGKWKVLLSKESINNSEELDLNSGATSMDTTSK